MQTNSVMREAFDNIKMKNVKKSAAKLAHSILNSLDRKVGLVRTDVWNANLSFKTFKSLKGNEGWNFERQPRMAYDNMVSGSE